MSRSHKIQLLRVFIVLFILFAGLYSQVFAFSVNLDPPSVHLTLKPGSVQSGHLTITNQSNKPYAFNVYLNDWQYLQDGSKKFLPSGTTQYSASNWIKLSSSKFELNASKEQKINYEINVPLYAKGSYYSVVFFEAVLGINSENINLAGRIGTIFYIDIEGTTESSGSIERFSVNEENNIAKIKVDFKNDGNTKLSPVGSLAIVGQNKQFVSKKNIYGVNTLPGDVVSRTYDFQITDEAYDVFLSLELDDGVFLTDQASIASKKTNQYSRSDISERLELDKLSVLPTTYKHIKSYARINNIGIYNEKVSVDLNVYKEDQLIEKINMGENINLKPKSQLLFKGFGKLKLDNELYQTTLKIKLSDGQLMSVNREVQVQ